MTATTHAEELARPGDPPHIHHMDPKTAYGAAKLGMWLFLGTEVLLFAVMFCSFAVMRFYHIAEFHEGSHHLNKWLGALNAILLLFSSYTASIAVSDAQRANNKGVVKNLSISIVCAVAFLAVKIFEYWTKYEHGMFLGGEHFYAFKNFLGLYFCMTMIHGLHVVIGIAVLAWIVGKARHDRFSERYFTPVECGVLYWHVVDLVWIFLFPLLYLVA